MLNIPTHIHGNPVRYVAILQTPLFPTGYPGDGGFERTVAFAIAISDEGDPDYERFWVRCIGENGLIMAGDMAFTLKAAMEFPATEFPIEDLSWSRYP